MALFFACARRGPALLNKSIPLSQVLVWSVLFQHSLSWPFIDERHVDDGEPPQKPSSMANKARRALVRLKRASGPHGPQGTDGM